MALPPFFRLVMQYHMAGRKCPANSSDSKALVGQAFACLLLNLDEAIKSQKKTG
jgi:hypothetical protein